MFENELPHERIDHVRELRQQNQRVAVVAQCVQPFDVHGQFGGHGSRGVHLACLVDYQDRTFREIVVDARRLDLFRAHVGHAELFAACFFPWDIARVNLPRAAVVKREQPFFVFQHHLAQQRGFSRAGRAGYQIDHLAAPFATPAASEKAQALNKMFSATPTPAIINT